MVGGFARFARAEPHFAGTMDGPDAQFDGTAVDGKSPVGLSYCRA